MYGATIQLLKKKSSEYKIGRYSIILGAIEYCLSVILVQVQTAKVLKCMLM